jgi:hypothetical protein
VRIHSRPGPLLIFPRARGPWRALLNSTPYTTAPSCCATPCAGGSCVPPWAPLQQVARPPYNWSWPLAFVMDTHAHTRPHTHAASSKQGLRSPSCVASRSFPFGHSVTSNTAALFARLFASIALSLFVLQQLDLVLFCLLAPLPPSFHSQPFRQRILASRSLLRALVLATASILHHVHPATFLHLRHFHFKTTFTSAPFCLVRCSVVSVSTHHKHLRTRFLALLRDKRTLPSHGLWTPSRLALLVSP